LRLPHRWFSVRVLTIFAPLCLLVCSGVRARPSAIKYVPFTAHIIEESFDGAASNEPARVTDIYFGRRSDGSESTATMVHSPDNAKVAPLVDILEIDSSKQIELEPFTKTMMTFQLSFAKLSELLDSRHCPVDLRETDVHSQILGYNVVRYQEMSGSDNRQITEDEWVAPYLACFTLKEIFATGMGPWNRTTVASLIEGDPPSSMFEIPPGYVERSPDELAAIWSATFPGSEWMPAASVGNLDQQYYAQRPKE
jgi:hypothetical protein